MVFDDNGNLYATHGEPLGSIWWITPDGSASEFVHGLQTPCGIVWAGGTSYGDYLYVVEYETEGGGIVKVGLDGTTSNFASMDPPKHAPSPLGLDKIDNYGGYLYIGTTGQDHTYQVDIHGNVTMFSNFPGWTDGGGPRDIDFDPGTNYGGLMYMATSFEYTPDVSGLFTLDTYGNAERFTPDLAAAVRAKFDPYGVFGGELFVIGRSELGQPRALWRVSPDGAATEFATTTASRGLAFGPDGAMYIAEYSSADQTVLISRVIPEPATVLLLSLGGLLLRRRR
jgi:hypothetical protein